LRDALIDDVGADLSEPINVRFSRAEIATLDRVVEKSVNRVTVILIILRRVDSTLGGDENAVMMRGRPS